MVCGTCAPEGVGWNMFGALPAAALALLAFTLVGGWFLGRLVGLRRPGDWLPVWGFVLGAAIYALKAHSSLTGWLLVLGLTGFTLCLWRTLRVMVPVQPLADERGEAEPVEALPETGGDWNA